MAVIVSDTGSLTPSLRTSVQSRVSVSLSRVPWPSTRRDRHSELVREPRELLGVVEEVGTMLADDVLGAIAEHALGAAVEDRDQPIGVGADDRVLRGRVEHARERVARRDGRRLARAQHLLGPSPFRDVARHGLQLDDGAVLVVARRARASRTRSSARPCAGSAPRRPPARARARTGSSGGCAAGRRDARDRRRSGRSAPPARSPAARGRRARRRCAPPAGRCS